MKKRTLSTLLLAGVMAAAMVPTAVFAATNTKSTTVGYTAGGNVSPDGTVMVSVPMTTDFKNTTASLDFNVKSYVWVMDTATGMGSWTDASANNPLGATITVKVKSENGFKLQRKAGDAKNAGEYTYTIPGLQKVEGSVLDGGVLTGTNQITIGTLKDASGQGTGGAKYSIDGTVQMTKAPNAGQLEGPTRFYDKLTYTFDGLQNIDANKKA